MGILAQGLSLLGEESFQTYLTVSLYIVPVLAVLSLVLCCGVKFYELANIPVVGVTGRGYFGLLDARGRFVTNSLEMLKEGYYKHRNRNFAMPTHSVDKIILTPAQVCELANAPDELVSFCESVEHSLQAKYTGVRRFKGTGYHESMARTKVIRNNGRLRGQVIDEAQFALGAELPSCDDWTPINLYPTVVRMVTRVAARAFFGLPLCRDEEFLNSSILFTSSVFTTVVDLSSTPWFVRPFRAFYKQYSRSVGNHRALAKSRLIPSAEARLAEDEAAKKAGKPPKDYGDLLQWYMDIAKPEHRTAEALAEMQLHIMMTMIYTGTLALGNVLLDLASHPEYIQQLREEIEAVIKEDGGVVQKSTLQKMRKLDSFIRECFRVAGLALFSFSRKVMKSFTLSDGTFLPKGVLVTAPIMMFDRDPELIEDPEVFDGFRSYKKNLANRAAGIFGNTRCFTTSPSFLTFGHGRHACPGRFFATDALKVLFCHLILQYDIRYDESNPRLPKSIVGDSVLPNQAQKLSFKKIPGPKKFDFL